MYEAMFETAAVLSLGLWLEQNKLRLERGNAVNWNECSLVAWRAHLVLPRDRNLGDCLLDHPLRGKLGVSPKAFQLVYDQLMKQSQNPLADHAALSTTQRYIDADVEAQRKVLELI